MGVVFFVKTTQTDLIDTDSVLFFLEFQYFNAKPSSNKIVWCFIKPFKNE